MVETDGKRKTHTSTAVKNKWNSKAYDTLNIRVKKGQRESIKEYAASKGESLNGFVNRAIDETIEREKGADTDASS